MADSTGGWRQSLAHCSTSGSARTAQASQCSPATCFAVSVGRTVRGARRLVFGSTRSSCPVRWPRRSRSPLPPAGYRAAATPVSASCTPALTSGSSPLRSRAKPPSALYNGRSVCRRCTRRCQGGCGISQVSTSTPGSGCQRECNMPSSQSASMVLSRTR